MTGAASPLTGIAVDELDPPLTRDYAFDYINGRVFEAVWIDDEIPW